jgi:crossover junction endodeoxyribonuclease RuvC
VRVLAVDPGLTRCGLGAVQGGRGRDVTLVAVDVVTTPAADELAVRLLAIGQAIGGWLDQVRPDVLAVERVFSQSNVSTVMGTAQAAGIAIFAAAERGIPVAVHTPSEVKAAVTGDGRAGKRQVAAMVTRILALPDTPRPADAADALALAICHLWRGGAGLGSAASAASAAGRPPGSLTAAQEQWRAAAEQARRGAARRPGASRPAAGAHPVR